MLFAKRCPHTGVVNYFSASDPHLAVASIARCGTSAAGFTWRCHASGAERSGLAPDLESAQQRLTSFLAITDTTLIGAKRARHRTDHVS